MKKEVLIRIKTSLEEMEGLYGGSCAEEEIQKSEKSLNCKFSDQYRNFLSTYGAGLFPGQAIHGLRKTLLMSDSIWSVVNKTNFYKVTQQWPGIEDWYIISDDGRGNPIGCKPDGSVWLSDHDAGFEQIKLANSFEEFLEKILDDTLYDDQCA
jgi:hypothetical protein